MGFLRDPLNGDVMDIKKNLNYLRLIIIVYTN